MLESAHELRKFTSPVGRTSSAHQRRPRHEKRTSNKNRAKKLCPPWVAHQCTSIAFSILNRAWQTAWQDEAVPKNGNVRTSIRTSLHIKELCHHGTAHQSAHQTWTAAPPRFKQPSLRTARAHINAHQSVANRQIRTSIQFGACGRVGWSAGRWGGPSPRFPELAKAAHQANGSMIRVWVARLWAAGCGESGGGGRTVKPAFGWPLPQPARSRFGRPWLGAGSKDASQQPSYLCLPSKIDASGVVALFWKTPPKDQLLNACQAESPWKTFFNHHVVHASQAKFIFQGCGPPQRRFPIPILSVPPTEAADVTTTKNLEYRSFQTATVRNWTRL